MTSADVIRDINSLFAAAFPKARVTPYQAKELAAAGVSPDSCEVVRPAVLLAPPPKAMRTKKGSKLKARMREMQRLAAIGRNGKKVER